MRSNLSRGHRSAAFVAVLVGLLVGGVVAQTPDPHIGSWKLNPAKSKYDPGPAPKSGTTKWEMVAAGIKVTAEDVQADGTTRHWETTTNYDGKDYPVTGNSPNGDTVARTRVDARTIQSVSKKGGKVTVTQTSVVAPDGKTRTVTTTGVNAAGQKVHNVAVYEKQ